MTHSEREITRAKRRRLHRVKRTESVDLPTMVVGIVSQAR